MDKPKLIFDIETTGLEKMSDIITCISYKTEDSETKTISLKDNTEEQLLWAFFEEVDKIQPNRLITFNGNSFDIPFIIKKALINRVRIPPTFLNASPVDLKKVANAFFYSYSKYEKGSLDDWAYYLEGTDTKETNGEEVVQAYYDGDFDIIHKHATYDVYLTEKLLKRCQECGLLNKE